MSLNASLATAARSLDLFSAGVQIAGNNISNASTPGYVREQMGVRTGLPYNKGNLLIGTGAFATGIRQQIDVHLETRIHSANGDYGAVSVRDATFTQLQMALGELGDDDLSSNLNNFLGKLTALSSQADATGQRQTTIQAGQQLVSQIQLLRGRIDGLRDASNQSAQSLADEANELIRTIAKLNPQISTLEANGMGQSDAGGLRVQRLNAINRLSEIVPLRAIEQPSGRVDLYSGNEYLLLDGHPQQLELTPSADGTSVIYDVRLSISGAPLTKAGGELQGAITSNAEILGAFTKELDRMTAGLITTFNKIHASGEGLVGYTDTTGTYGVADPTVSLADAGLPFPPRHGSFTVKVRNTETGAETLHTINVDLDGVGADTSLNDLAAQLGGIGHVTAGVSGSGKLRLQTDAGYEIRFADDTSGALAGLGLNTFFTGKDSSDIGLNTQILQDQRLLATGRGGGPSDSTNLLALSQFADQAVGELGGLSVTKFYEQAFGGVVQSAAAETALKGGFESFRGSLKTQREQISGVSLDEELVQIMQLQHSYQAAARIVSVVDQLMNTLLNI